MGWAEKMAKELKNRENKSDPIWVAGYVKSPIRTVDPVSQVERYEGPLIISCFDGAVDLRADRLRLFQGAPQIYSGQTVALLGDVFSRTPGSQKLLVLGVL